MPLLKRKRRHGKSLGVPPLGAWLLQSLELALGIVPAKQAFVLLDHPRRRTRLAALHVIAAAGETPAASLGQQVAPLPTAGVSVHHPAPTAVALLSSEVRLGLSADSPDMAQWLWALAGKSGVSWALAPILLERTVCGWLVLLDRKRRPFSARDLASIELVSRYLGRTLENAVDLLKQRDLALRDELTGLGNVRALSLDMAAELARVEADGGHLALAFADLDHLKTVNDTLGHQAGSSAIADAGRLMDKVLGDRGSVFRFGGDEFVLLLGSVDLEAAGVVVAEIVAAVAEAADTLEMLTISVGVAELRALPGTLTRSAPQHSGVGLFAGAGHALLVAADRALYRAKAAGRNCVMLAAPTDLS